MSIKGNTQELFIGKEEVNIITFLGNKITIPYSNMKCLKYCYASKLKSGFLLFVKNDGKNTQFDFGHKVNEKIVRTIDYVHEHQPQLKTFEFDTNEFKNNRSASLVPISGYKELGLSPLMLSIHQRTDGSIYFNSDIANLFILTDYEWNGAEYDVVTKAVTNSKENSTTKKQGKALKIGTGAILGQAIVPGVGMLVGAAMGAGSKGKEKTRGSNTQNTQQIEKTIEKNTIAFISLVNINSKKNYKLSFNCNSKLDAIMRCFELTPPDTKEALVNDISESVKGIKALKELLDLGVITQEEFNKKKEEFLNL